MRMYMIATRFPQSLVISLSLFLSATTLAAELFPKPVEIEPDVAFWLRVYTEIDTSKGYIHDAYNVEVVYETLKLTGQRKADRKLISAAKDRYASILQQLINDRDQLTTEEQRILALWGSNVSNARLQKASSDMRFQRGQSDRFKEGLKRSGEWHEHIEKVMIKNNLPPELALLPHVESSFNPEAYSSAGAAGIWQFTRSTGRRYMHIDYVVDQRMDPFAATIAAAQLLKHNYQLTGTWPLAITAYNHGAAGVRRASKQLGTNDIGSISRNYRGRNFGFASRNFYLSFLAAMEASKHPELYFGPLKVTSPIDYAEVTLPDYLLLESFSRAFNVDSDILKEHNRSLLDPVWQGKKRIPQGYTMRIPCASMVGSASELLASIPTEQRFAEQTPDLFH
ncbi:MAG: lytic transglycosylase domain-containing protein, partial [Halieaceae bacterium]|nr:lytic transglycosylase domain-containing protein [Halieaceae bacterium]